MTFPLSHRLLIAVTLTLTVLTGALQAKSFRYVIIDPGHGGHDRGGHHGLVYEKHLALDTALRLEHYLKSKGIRTKMTRRSDVFISLPGRASYGNRYSKSIFVSVHYNSTWKRDTLGLETYYYSSKSKKLATHVQSSMMRKLRTPNRGVKHAKFYVIRHSKHPSILVECGFVTNRRERSRMKKAWFRQSIAEGIGEGILNYKRSW
ncbi:MAG: N-acetylmuramoyl-L-alanine amidase [Verrucomicrobiae bacterium]|nr:N-acetylmuramoyl-L-alanine amidase [Verrucomicrobiae bacterium]NNJ42316.1 N-acetylmuramoyl-L-alanine amidase [Akkermansiaceae bacterium]